MFRIGKTALAFVAACAMWIVAVPARAQQTTSPVVKAKPLHTPGQKPVRGRFQVLHMMTTGIQVRSASNYAEIHTFAYSDRIHNRMMAMLNHGGYQYGDKVKILYVPDTQVAIRIEGRPSKPIVP